MCESTWEIVSQLWDSPKLVRKSYDVFASQIKHPHFRNYKTALRWRFLFVFLLWENHLHYYSFYLMLSGNFPPFIPPPRSFSTHAIILHQHYRKRSRTSNKWKNVVNEKHFCGKLRRLERKRERGKKLFSTLRKPLLGMDENLIILEPRMCEHIDYMKLLCHGVVLFIDASFSPCYFAVRRRSIFQPCFSLDWKL